MTKAHISFRTLASVIFALGLFGTTAFGQSATDESCQNLKSVQIPETTVVSAVSVAAGEFTPPMPGGMPGGPRPRDLRGGHRQPGRCAADHRRAELCAPDCPWED
jgi:hypothetical protein